MKNIRKLIVAGAVVLTAVVGGASAAWAHHADVTIVQPTCNTSGEVVQSLTVKVQDWTTDDTNHQAENPDLEVRVNGSVLTHVALGYGQYEQDITFSATAGQSYTVKVTAIAPWVDGDTTRGPWTSNTVTVPQPCGPTTTTTPPTTTPPTTAPPTTTPATTAPPTTRPRTPPTSPAPPVTIGIVTTTVAPPVSVRPVQPTTPATQATTPPTGTPDLATAQAASLPNTGSDTWVLVALGLVLVGGGVGVAALAYVRRKGAVS